MAKPQSPNEILVLLGGELYLLWAQMDTYQTLYLIEQEKRQQLMQKAAPGFFILFQATLIESLLLRICRLLDPAKQGGNVNLSFESLWLLLAEGEHADERSSRKALRLALRELLNDWSPCRCDKTGKTVDKYARLKNLRRKVLAHNDFKARKKKPDDEIWTADVSEQDFELIKEMAARLWSTYCMAKCEIEGSDEIEPRHEKLSDQPVMLLRALAAGLCLEELVDDEIALQAQNCISVRVGDERPQPVFGKEA